jgi:hypothetical protein
MTQIDIEKKASGYFFLSDTLFTSKYANVKMVLHQQRKPILE